MAFGPQPYTPPKITAPRAYVPPPQDINALIAQAQAQRVASMGQLPLTRTLPGLGSGAGDVSALYTRPLNTQPLGLSRALPKIGPGAGDVSELLAPKALGAGPQPAISGVTGPNPAASRAIRGGWEYTPGTTQVPGQQLALGPGQPLPPPPTAAVAQYAPETIGQTARGAVSGMGGSFLPGASGWKGTGANLLASVALQYGGNAAAQAAGGQDTTAGRLIGSATRGGGIGAIGGPKAAAALGATNVTMQAGAEKRRAYDEGGLTAVADQMTPNSISEVPLAALDAATLPFTAPWQAIGAVAGGDLGSLPLVGGLFGGGGGDEQAKTEDQAQAPRDYSFNSIRQTAASMGLDPTMTNQLEQQYNSTVAYMKGNPVISIVDPKTGQVDAADKKSFEDMGYKVDKAGNVQVDDNYIQQAAWQNAYQALPQAQAQALQTADFARRQAAMQAAIMEVIPQFTQPFYDTANMGYGSLGEMVSGLPPAQQAAGQQLVDSGRMWSGRMGDAVAASLANLPGYLAMNQQVDQANSMAAQIQQAQNQKALAAMYPDLFGQQSSSSGLSLNDLLAASGG